MPANRVLATDEATDLIALVRDICAKELAPKAVEAEATETFPREVLGVLGRAGVLGLPYAEEYGGGGQPYEVYLQAVEEIGYAWSSVGVGTSVHVLSCFGLDTMGTEEQKRRWLPDMLGGELLGAYCLSEPHAGSDPAAMTTRAVRDGDEYVLTGAKAWTTHGGHADFYKVLARTSENRNGISCFLVPADAPGLTADPPERKMGLTGSATATMRLDGVHVPVERRLGEEGDGLKIALAGLDAGRLGIAAVATGLAQAALDAAVAYAQERETFGKRIFDHQGLAFVLSDIAAAVESARATYLAAARRKDLGLPYSREASIAKLVATDNAMKATTEAVQVFGGYGYTRDFPVERFMREAKVMQIFEGTNQIQRMVIARHLDKK
ncbi:acyl-CoA dehydrogenase [Streptomyces humidus]|uniref:Acyl-CoA dehydrogenase n=1 Tax=Streptomyces humidus TaxID=52259 RepID=A0A918GF00_9ACTN|nr:acyl-CoA dehydrogenase family protein [Streptomyces humidus]GGS31795.1 acyl-CoA dehydrogenase [Streptomyces humidus]